MNKHILVAGDSWAVGEWSGPSVNDVVHGGIGQYLNEDGYETLCFGYPGQGNLFVYDTVNNFVRYNRDRLNIDQIVFFQSDWIRDIRSYRWLNDDHLDILQQGYGHTRNWYVSYLYYRLSELYKEFGITSTIIGGQADTVWIDQFETEYPGVRIGCQSFTNLIMNDAARIESPVHSVFKYGGTASRYLSQQQFDLLLQQIKSNSDHTDLQLLINDMELAQERDRIFVSNRDHFPDGLHPGRKAHKKLYEHLQHSNLL